MQGGTGVIGYGYGDVSFEGEQGFVGTARVYEWHPYTICIILLKLFVSRLKTECSHYPDIDANGVGAPFYKPVVDKPAIHLGAAYAKGWSQRSRWATSDRGLRFFLPLPMVDTG